jgi:hypothetical protein
MSVEKTMKWASLNTSKEETKNIYIGTCVSTSFYRQIRDNMAKHCFENVSEFVQYMLHKVMEEQKI